MPTKGLLESTRERSHVEPIPDSDHSKYCVNSKHAGDQPASVQQRSRPDHPGVYTCAPVGGLTMSSSRLEQKSRLDADIGRTHAPSRLWRSSSAPPGNEGCHRFSSRSARITILCCPHIQPQLQQGTHTHRSIWGWPAYQARPGRYTSPSHPPPKQGNATCIFDTHGTDATAWQAWRGRRGSPAATGSGPSLLAR